MQQPNAHAVSEGEGDEAGEQAIDDEPRLVFLHALHVHLQGGEKHDVVESHLTKELKGRVTFQDIESILAHQDTCQHHSDDVRNAQLAHDDRGKEDNEHHHEEDQRRVGNREVLDNIYHWLSSLSVMLKERFRHPPSPLSFCFLSAKLLIILERAKFLRSYPFIVEIFL